MRPRVQYLLNCYAGENLIEVSENGERSFEAQSSELLAQALIPGFENPNVNVRNVQLDPAQRQRIRELAISLRRSADSMKIRPTSALLSVERAISANENLNDDERLVIRNILSEKLPTSVSRVVEHLRRCMTSRTFRAALRYLCYSASSAPEELTIACELAKTAYPTIRQLSRTDSVCEVINDFIEEKLDEIMR